MEWPKLKNIIILILVLTNLCLLGLVGSREVRDARLQSQNRQEAIRFLHNHDVEVEETLVPETVDVTPLRVERELEEEMKLARRLLKGDVSVTALGGEVYRYENARGWLQLHGDGSFRAEFTPGTWSVDRSVEQTALDVLEKLGFRGRVLRHTGNTVLVEQTWNDAPLFLVRVEVQWEDGEITALTSGRRLMGVAKEQEQVQTLSVATALMEFHTRMDARGYVYSAIQQIEQGYVAQTALDSVTELIPVWQVTTDTGVYRLDLVDGTLSAAEN